MTRAHAPGRTFYSVAAPDPAGLVFFAVMGEPHIWSGVHREVAPHTFERLAAEFRDYEYPPAAGALPRRSRDLEPAFLSEPFVFYPAFDPATMVEQRERVFPAFLDLQRPTRDVHTFELLFELLDPEPPPDHVAVFLELAGAGRHQDFLDLAAALGIPREDHAPMWRGTVRRLGKEAAW